ncbi:hypothetical protein F5Y19DRAFT_229317 [Xylariaceae sp. FL1651]|nr:hypothetical protein F5Y19DRAFT_229317 [Xylariaceae sp. FL1651]
MEIPEMPCFESAAAEKPEINTKAELDHHPEKNNVFNEERGVKRPADDELDGGYEDEEAEGDDGQSPNSFGGPTEVTNLSKNKLRKLKKQKRWEENKQQRRLKRKDKRHDRQARKRAEKEQELAAAAAEGREPVLNNDRRRHKSQSGTKVPVAIIVDCQFEKYMQEVELVSLASQVTRCYSDNRGAQHPVHLYVSSYGGLLKERHETVLENQHRQWKNIRFCEDDFVQTASQAKECMAGPGGGKMIDLLQQTSSHESITLATPTVANPKKARLAPTPEPEAEDVDKSIVYLTADSPYTLERLEPNTCYVVGGIIDKNREKGLCYKIAREKNVRTAKLPIGEYMVLQHRHILATNHVVEIMLRWLETGDWATAFMKAIPTRKGGKLKTDEDTPTEPAEGERSEQPVHDKTSVDVTQPENQANSGDQDANGIVEVEGDNAEEGLHTNSLDQQRWSAPPLELEVVEGGPANSTVS